MRIPLAARIGLQRFTPLLVLALWPRIAGAQSPADRGYLDSLAISLANPTPPSVDGCTRGTATLRRLCTGLITVQRAAVSGAVSDASKSRDIFDRLVEEEPKWPVAWYGLGLARVQAARAKMIAREGPLQPLGVSFEAGAGYALVRSLELDSTYLPAAEALALISIPREGASRLAERIAMLRRVRANLSGKGSYGAAQVELAGGDASSAVNYLLDAMQRHDIDSGMVLLSLARAYHRADRPAEGFAALIRGTRDSAAASRSAYHQELNWVASPAEMVEWDSLPVPSRATWLTAFWGTRDVGEGRGEGDRLIEHYRRYEHVMKEYTLELPRTGQHKISRSSMAGDYIDIDQAVADMRRNAVEDTKPGETPIQQSISEQSDRKNLFGSTASLQQFRSLTTFFDDRGLVYIRQGPADHFARTVGGQAMEAWSYERDGGAPLVLYFKEQDFDGQAGASALTPQVLTSYAQERAQLCHLDPVTCPLAADPRVTTPQGSGNSRLVAGGGGRSGATMALGREANNTSSNRVADAVRRGLASIDTAVHTDRYARKFSSAIRPAIQIASVRHTSDGGARMLVIFAIPGEQLVSQVLSDGSGRIVYPVKFLVTAARRSDGKRFSLDTLRAFIAPRVLRAGEMISGMFELAVEPGEYTGSLALTQEDGRGAVARINRTVVPGSKEALSISDVVLGSAESRVRWNSGSSIVPLNPSNALAANATAELYAQLSGMKPGQKYELSFQVFRADDASDDKPRLSINFAQPFSDALVEVQRSVALNRLDPGRYRVRVTFSGGGEKSVASTVLTVVKP